MKIIQLFRSETGDLALDSEGNIFRIIPVIGSEHLDGVIYWENELKFVKIKQIFKDSIKE